jgi:hypothetical protein
MSSYLHALLILLFRNRSSSAADLMREFDVEIPEYDDIRFESSDLGNAQPAEYRADLVLFLMRGLHKLLGAIVEVQLACDKDKPYVWPAYVANLRARHRCVELAVLSAVEQGQSKDTRLATRIASAAIVASAGIDTDRSRLYLDLRGAAELHSTHSSRSRCGSHIFPGPAPDGHWSGR